MMWYVDGLSWDIPCTIERVAEVTASEISGMLLNKQYFNDIIGTYMKYDISIAIPVGMEDDYADLYEVLTEPVDAHAFVLPYNQSTISITGRVQTISDSYYGTENGTQIWRGTKFSIIANHPSKEMSLSQAISHGISPVPDVQGAVVGDIYELTQDGWQLTDFQDADGVAY